MSQVNLSCSECNGTGLMRDPFGGPDEMLPCTCLDQAEVERAEALTLADRLPFGRQELLELLDMLERAKQEHDADAALLKERGMKDWHQGAATAYRVVTTMFQDLLQEQERDEAGEDVPSRVA